MANELKRSLGFVTLIALGAAGVVGNSWIYTNGEFFALYGAGGEIFGLAIATLLACGIALAYSELASTIPRAGGEVVYAYTAFNRRLAFVAGWLVIGAFVSSLSFYVTAFGSLLADIAPWLETAPLYTINGVTVYLPVLALGVALTLLVFGLNWYGASLGGTIQVLVFGVMVVLGIALAVVGFWHGTAANFWPPYTEKGSPVKQTARFILPAMTFLTGFSLVSILAEDAKIKPRRIARGVVLTVVIAGAFYCLVLLASAWVIPWQQTANTDNGTIDAFRKAGFGILGGAAYLISVLGLLTSVFGVFIATSRVVLAMGRAHVLPAALGRVRGPRSTPGAALVFTLAVTLGLGWLGTGAITWFLDSGGVYIGLAWAVAVLCFYRMPRRHPDLVPAYRVRMRWAPAIGGAAAVLVIAFSLWPGTDQSLVWPQEYIILGAWAALGIVCYLLSPRGSDERARQVLLGDQAEVLTSQQHR